MSDGSQTEMPTSEIPWPPSDEYWKSLIDSEEGQKKVIVGSAVPDIPSDFDQRVEDDDPTFMPDFVSLEEFLSTEYDKEKSAYEARHDVMTRLLNRRAFDEALEILKQSEDPAVLLVLDVNDLHQLNTEYSDSTGDAVLKRIASELQSIIGINPKDLPGIGIYRTGGDEFAVILRNFPEKGLDSLRERIQENFAHANQKLFRAKAGLSVGVVYIPDGLSDMRGNAYKVAAEIVHAVKLKPNKVHFDGFDWKDTRVEIYSEDKFGTVLDVVAQYDARSTRKVR